MDYKIFQIVINSNLQDLNPLLTGFAEANVENSKPPMIYNYMLLHYVLQGEGTFTVDDKVYPVREGQAFLIKPGNVAGFQADPDNPWSFRWIGFAGSLSQYFSLFPPVFEFPKEIKSTFCGPFDPSISKTALSCLLSSELLLLYAKLLVPIDNKQDYIQQVIEYVQHHYAEPITVESIAATLGLTRSYLTDIFHKKMGKTIRSYIIETRILAAKQHLMDGSSVKETALLSGFSDVSYFVKRFSKETGRTPTAWKQKTDNDRNQFISR